MRVLYDGVIYNCYTAESSEWSKKITLISENNGLNMEKNKIDIYFKNTESMNNCFEDLLVNGYVNMDRYNSY